MFPLEAFQQTLTKIVGVFESHGIGFHLTGGITSIAYGEPRMTQDVDIVIDNAVASENLDSMLQGFAEAEFLFDEAAIRDAISGKRLFQLLDTVESLKVDIYPRELIPGELSRSESREVFPGMKLPVASLADAAASKLIWISKGSHKNRRDVRQIVSRSTPDQLRQIESLADSLQLRELLTEVLAEPDEIE